MQKSTVYLCASYDSALMDVATVQELSYSVQQQCSVQSGTESPVSHIPHIRHGLSHSIHDGHVLDGIRGIQYQMVFTGDSVPDCKLHSFCTVLHSWPPKNIKLWTEH